MCACVFLVCVVLVLFASYIVSVITVQVKCGFRHFHCRHSEITACFTRQGCWEQSLSVSTISVAPRRHWCPLIKSGYFAATVLPLFSFLYSRAIEFAVTSFDKRSVARIPDKVVGKLITKSWWPNNNQHKYKTTINFLLGRGKEAAEKHRILVYLKLAWIWRTNVFLYLSIKILDFSSLVFPGRVERN